MPQIDPPIKLIIELFELSCLLAYLMAGWDTPKRRSYWLAAGGAVCLGIDIVILHGEHSRLTWGALNTPLLVWIGGFIYAKILRKFWPKLKQRVQIILALLCG